MTALSDKQKIVRVFIGSPGGLTDERRAAHEVVNSVNRSHADRWGLQFKLMGWEDTVPGFARPQSKINDDLDKCDYFIGVLWDHWGSRPDVAGGAYTSGFEEEFVRATQRIENGLMRDMALYFKTVEIQRGMEPNDGLRRVLKFRQRCIDDKKVFFKDFNTPQDFKDLVREKLEEIGWKETELAATSASEPEQARDVSADQGVVEKKSPGSSELFDLEAQSFLTELSTREGPYELTTAYEVARLRLIGASVMRSGNDETTLENHDANLIYQAYRGAPLSSQEIRTLISCGVNGFQHQNVPLWTWMTRQDDDCWDQVNFLAILGSDTEQKNALDLLALGDRPIPFLSGYIDQKRVLSRWFSDDRSSTVFEAALDYLAHAGRIEDLPLIEEVAVDTAAYRRAKIEVAIAAIMSRTNADAALKRIGSGDADKVGPAIAEVLFASPESLSTATLKASVNAKSDSIRERVVNVLGERGEIDTAMAEILLTDSSHEVRLLAASALRKKGMELDDKVAKEALMIIKPANRLLGLFARNESDDSYYERYNSSRLSELDFKTLLKLVDGSPNLVNHREMAALYRHHSSRMQKEIRANLSDRFRGFITDRLERRRATGQYSEQIERDITEIMPYWRRLLCEAGLAGICKIGDKKDLPLVREVLTDTDVVATTELLSFFSKFGEWSDIELVKNLGDKADTPTGLLGLAQTKMPREKAVAILSIGKSRLADTLSLELHPSIKRWMARSLPQASIAKLSDEILLRELRSKEDDYRASFALKCIQALPRQRITTLLDRYMNSEEPRFYNSTHWLDLGASFPARAAKQISTRMLSTLIATTSW